MLVRVMAGDMYYQDRDDPKALLCFGFFRLPTEVELIRKLTAEEWYCCKLEGIDGDVVEAGDYLKSPHFAGFYEAVVLGRRVILATYLECSAA
jgi:hypothetical protein